MDWSKYPNFEPQEFACLHTGEVEMTPGFMDKLQALRTEYGKPMRVTSGYRSPEHPIEAAKDKPGSHASGCAVDISVNSIDAYTLVKLAIKHGFTGIGISQKQGSRFVHLDTLDEYPRPNIWTY